MVWSTIRLSAWLDLAVVLFQVVGVVALCWNRLLPASRWAVHVRYGFVFALVGLGVAGALCGRHDSEFALFAGGTMTLLLIGMIMGNSQGHATVSTRVLRVRETHLAT
ncbi:MAG: hypothetical protein NVSMB9_29950 [Isosphaeraceae bacterium]